MHQTGCLRLEVSRPHARIGVMWRAVGCFLTFHLTNLGRDVRREFEFSPRVAIDVNMYCCFLVPAKYQSHKCGLLSRTLVTVVSPAF